MGEQERDASVSSQSESADTSSRSRYGTMRAARLGDKLPMFPINPLLSSDADRAMLGIRCPRPRGRPPGRPLRHETLREVELDLLDCVGIASVISKRLRSATPPPFTIGQRTNSMDVEEECAVVEDVLVSISCALTASPSSANGDIDAMAQQHTLHTLECLWLGARCRMLEAAPPPSITQ